MRCAGGDGFERAVDLAEARSRDEGPRATTDTTAASTLYTCAEDSMPGLVEASSTRGGIRYSVPGPCSIPGRRGSACKRLELAVEERQEGGMQSFDILIDILRHVDPVSLGRSRAVSSQWRDIATGSKMWKAHVPLWCATAPQLHPEPSRPLPPGHATPPDGAIRCEVARDGHQT